jgi:S-adenosylmethionine:tRNA ribosyltransferase-isomerase
VKAAVAPRPVEAHRLLRIDPALGRHAHHRVDELPNLLSPGDLLVVNDAATLPASLRIAHRDAELRLVRRGESDAEWTAVLFGKGDFRTPTEARAEPPRIVPGEQLELEDGTVVVVTRVDADQPRLVDVRFALSGAELFRALYRAGRPVQYAYLARELELWDFQNRFASRPWAFEMPSAGHFLTWELLLALRARGVGLAHVTHAAGISSTGSLDLDRRFPMPERYEIGNRAIRAIRETKERKGRVVAVGTTVVRALEASHAEHGALEAGSGEARLLLGPGFQPKVVDGILSGMHENGTSHFALLEAFANEDLLRSALVEAERAGYVQHEFGDATLVLPSRPE